MARPQHAFAPLPDFKARCASVAAAVARRAPDALPPPDHVADGIRVCRQLGHHEEAIRHYFRAAEAVALAEAQEAGR